MLIKLRHLADLNPSTQNAISPHPAFGKERAGVSITQQGLTQPLKRDDTLKMKRPIPHSVSDTVYEPFLVPTDPPLRGLDHVLLGSDHVLKGGAKIYSNSPLISFWFFLVKNFLPISSWANNSLLRHRCRHRFQKYDAVLSIQKSPAPDPGGQKSLCLRLICSLNEGRRPDCPIPNCL